MVLFLFLSINLWQALTARLTMLYLFSFHQPVAGSLVARLALLTYFLNGYVIIIYNCGLMFVACLTMKMWLSFNHLRQLD